MKKFVIIILITCMIPISAYSATEVYKFVKTGNMVYVNGERINTDVFVCNGTSYIPLKTIESFGSKITIKNKKIYITNGKQDPWNIIDKTNKSIVFLNVTLHIYIDEEHSGVRNFTGSGIVIGKETVLTCYHVVNEGKKEKDTTDIQVTTTERSELTTEDIILNDGSMKEFHNMIYPTKYNVTETLYENKDLDISILKVPGLNVEPIKIGDSSRLKVGENVISIGSPAKEFNSVSMGVMSGLRTRNGNLSIQTTAVTNHGDSGGALLNMNGELVGVCSSMLTDYRNINYAIPINEIKY